MSDPRAFARLITALLGAAVTIAMLASAAQAEPAVPTRAGQQYLEVRQADGSYEPIYVKGMNLSVAQPGRHPTGFPRDEELYGQWLRGIAEMNCNVVRVYTLHPPDFYNALAKYNAENRDKPLWLIQGVWAVAPEGYDYLAEDYMAEMELNLRNAVNAVHGRADFDERPGWTGGRYKTDVSKYLLAWLVGREWEPDDIQGFHSLRPDYTTYQGTHISCLDGQPIECWLAQICDYTASYEDANYNVQRPVAFSSWPPTDPLSHVSESNLEEEEDEGGMIQRDGRVDIFSNDAVNLTSKHFTVSEDYKAGIYASYHVYTYWPDFLDNEPKYAQASDRFGPSNYFGYLQDLKAFYDDRPLLIAEYGLPNGPLPCHLQRQGWHHGGLSEEEVASALPRLSQSIHDAGCAGGILFAWMDEWFKKVWLWAEFYNPWEDRRLWYNFYDPEENYGMLAMLPGADGPNCTLSGGAEEWTTASLRPGVCVRNSADTGEIRAVKVMHDEGFLFVRIELSSFDDWEFAEHGLYLGLDVLGDERGNASWPGPLRLSSDRGLEEVVTIAMGEARLWQTESFRFWEPFQMPYSSKPRIGEVLPHILEAEANRWWWYEPVLETNRRRVGRDGMVFEHRSWAVNPLPRGSLLEGPGHNSQAVWNVSADNGAIEVRLPWIMLGYVGPHQRRVLQADENGNNSSEVSAGVGVAVVLADAAGKDLAVWPGREGDTVLTSAAGRYAWEEWGEEEISFHTRYKPAYYALQTYFGGSELAAEPTVPSEEPETETAAEPVAEEAPPGTVLHRKQ